jgi:hypothetical protein
MLHNSRKIAKATNGGALFLLPISHYPEINTDSNRVYQLKGLIASGHGDIEAAGIWRQLRKDE